jgi:DNA-binding NarL/FixJ family response regulator
MQVGIVDDHPLFRLGMRQALTGQPGIAVRWDVGSAGQARRLLQEAPVDLVLMDVYLSDIMDGVDATRILVREHPTVPVVMMSAVLDEHVVYAAGKAGASAYLSKHLGPEELASSIRSIAASSLGQRRSARGFKVLTGTKATLRPKLDGKLDLLSKREMQVLEQIRAGRTNREIATRLGVSTTTVNKHVHRVLSKLNARNRAQAATLLRDPLDGSLTAS